MCVLVQIANGEEEERVIFEVRANTSSFLIHVGSQGLTTSFFFNVQKRAKLFKLVGADYVEVGIGPFRVLKPKDARDLDQARASARMVMRRESHPHGPGTKLILNARLMACVSCVKKSEKSLMLVIVEAPGEETGEVEDDAAKAKEVPEAIRKGTEQARKNIFKIPLVKGTIPHEIIGIFGAGEVLLRPASPGTGIIAGGAVRPVLEVAGIQDILTKCIGSRNPHNTIHATIAALKLLRSIEETARVRGKQVEELTA